MTEEQNHWDHLIASLGVTPPPQEEGKRPAPPPSELPRLVKPASRPSAPPTQPPTDWDHIAGQLGLKVEPITSFSGTEEKPSLNEISMAEEARVESVPPETAITAEEQESLDESDREQPLAAVEPRRKKSSDKRRRRRRRRPTPQDTAKKATASAVADSSAGMPEEDKRLLEGDALQPTSSSWPSEHEMVIGLEPAEQASLAAVAADEVQHPPTDATVLGAEQVEPSPRAAFRGIPTWEEVVGIIITNNMASRQRGGNDPGRFSRSSRK